MLRSDSLATTWRGLFALRLSVFVFAATVAIERACADVVVLANRTAKAVRCELVDAGQTLKPYSIEPGDLVTVHVRGPTEVRFTSGGIRRELNLETDAAYYFHTTRTSDDPKLEQIGLGSGEEADLGSDDGLGDKAHDEVNPDGAPQGGKENPDEFDSNSRPAAEQNAPAAIPVMLLVDDEEPAARAAWEKRLKKRLAAASDSIERHCGVKFEVVALKTWNSNDAVDDFTKTMEEFERAVDPSPARIAIGFCSQLQEQDTDRSEHGRSEHLGATRGPLHSHILIREWSKKISEPERLEALIHELGHFLGGVHSPEPTSVMRSNLGDGRAVARNFRIGFDPLNTLAMALVGEELRDRDLKNLFDVRPKRRLQLSEIYSTFVVVMPDDPVAADYLTRLEPPVAAADPRVTEQRATEQRAEVARPIDDQRPAEIPVKPRRPVGDVGPLVNDVRGVLEAVVAVARRNHDLAAPDDPRAEGPDQLAGHELTELYVRQAAMAAAKNVAKGQRATALFLGLAIGLDRSDTLRKYAVLGDLVKRIETDEERELRLEVLGKPTMHGRYDLTQHFVISAAVTAMAGAKSAEAVGLAKELRDSDGGSGFSFVDWCADLAGVALASHVLANEFSPSTLATSFRVASYLPEIEGLPEGLTREEFTRTFGSTSDPRFRRIDRVIRSRIDRLYEAPDGQLPR